MTSAPARALTLTRSSAALVAAAALVLGTLTPAVAAERTVGVVEAHGDAAITAWAVHDVEVTTPGPVQVTLSWDDPTAELKAFLRPPDGGSVASRRGASPIVLDHDATQLGTWSVAVKTLVGATPYVLRVEVEGSDAPTAPLPALRQPYDTPTSSWQAVGRVRSIVRVGDQLWLGGHFQSIAERGVKTSEAQTLVRERLAVLDAVTGEPLPHAPAFDNKIWSMAASPDGSVMYVAGSFRNVDGVARSRLAAIDTATGALLPWNPDASGTVRTVTVTPDGSRVLVGGQFSRIGGTTQKYVAAVSPTTGALQEDFRPVVRQVAGDCPPRCSPKVTSFAFGADDTLYIGGHFGLLNGEPRNSGGAVHMSAPEVALAWAPDVYTEGDLNPRQKNVILMMVVPPADSEFTDRVIICGDWNHIAGTASPKIEAVDAVTGVPIEGWTASTDGGTPACVGDRTSVYVGGHFGKAGGRIANVHGEQRRHLAAFALADGALLPWDPGVNSALGVHTMTMDGDRIHVGGDFSRAAGALQRGMATFLLRPYPEDR